MEFIGYKTKEEIEDFLKTRIESLCFTTRTENALKNGSIRTIGGILRRNGSSLFEIDGMGIKGVDEIKKVLLGSFDISISKKGGEYEYLQFVPKYYKVEKSSQDSTLKELAELNKIKEDNKEKEEIDSINYKTKEEIEDYLKTRVDSLGLSKRFENALIRESIRTIGGIVRKSGQALLEIDGMGVKGVEEIKEELSEMFDIKINGKDFKFIPKYLRTKNFTIDTNFKEQTEEEKVIEENKRKEFQIIEEKYLEKQEEKKFIHQIKIVSLGIDPKIETILLRNKILRVGDLLIETAENLREKYSLNNEEVDSILDIFNYLILKNTQIEGEQEELRIKVFELIGYLPHKLEKKESFIAEEYVKINSRNLNIFNSYREGLTLDQIGKENNITRERVRQVIKITLEKMGLNHKEEKEKISSIRRESKPKKIKREKKWGAYKYNICKVCNTIEFPHFRNGVCERCAGSFRGKTREKILLLHDYKCDFCGIFRDMARETYRRDLYISKKIEVLCRKCYLITTGKILGDSRKNKWKMFYK